MHFGTNFRLNSTEVGGGAGAPDVPTLGTVNTPNPDAAPPDRGTGRATDPAAEPTTPAPATATAGTDPAALDRLWRVLRICLDLLIAVLWLFTVVRGDDWRTWGWAAAFALVYAAGRFRSDEYGPGLPTWPWLAALSATFAGLAWATPDAAYLVFPLFFVIMHVAAGWAAIALALTLTVVSIAGIARHGEFGVGGVVGPVLGVTVAIGVGLGFRLLMREAQARERAIAELVAARADVAAMSRRAGELDERARLAADIHDTVAQGLSSIQLLLHSAERTIDPAEPALEPIRMARRVAADNLAETRRIIAALQPAPLSGADLPLALARVCAATPVTADGATATFSVDGDPVPLPEDIETALLRVCQASVGNVGKHARATKCSVTLTYQPDAVTLDVVDDGVGFDPATPAAPGAMGIDGVRRRMAALGGDVTIESAPGAGCGVSARIPLPEDGCGPTDGGATEPAPTSHPTPEEQP